jgi:hypothetical protein
MCEDCETETLYESYAQKRARIAAYWRPARYDMYAVIAVEAKPSSSEPEKESRVQT